MPQKGQKFIGAAGNVSLGEFSSAAAGTLIKLFSSGAAADVITFKLGSWIAFTGPQNIEVSADVVDMEGRDWNVTTRAPRAVELTLTTVATTSHHFLVFSGPNVQ